MIFIKHIYINLITLSLKPLNIIKFIKRIIFIHKYLHFYDMWL